MRYHIPVNPLQTHHMIAIRLSILLSLSLALAFAGCSNKPPDFFSGYAEGDYVRLAPSVAGMLTHLSAKRGDRLAAGAPAFVLEQENEHAKRQEALSRVQRTQDQLANLKKGKRPDEVATVQAQLAQADAALRLSVTELNRHKKLLADKFISPASIDQTRAAVERDQAGVNALRAQLKVAQLGARPDEISAAEKDVKTAEAQLAQADWLLAQRAQRIPVDADVADVYYQEGEWVPAGGAVLTLLPPQNIKVRFFVPEPIVGSLHVGQQVALRCDGCGADIAATISFIAHDAEYTSPLIYSKENRSTLVFLLEAKPAPQDARRLHPGQPLEIRLVAGKAS